MFINLSIFHVRIWKTYAHSHYPLPPVNQQFDSSALAFIGLCKM